MTLLYSGRVLTGSLNFLELLRSSVKRTCLDESSLSNILDVLSPFDFWRRSNVNSTVVAWYSSSICSLIFTAGIAAAFARGQNFIAFALRSIFFAFFVCFWSQCNLKGCKCWTTSNDAATSWQKLMMISNLQCPLFFSSPCMITTSRFFNASSLEAPPQTRYLQQLMYLARFCRSRTSMLSASFSNLKFDCRRIIKCGVRIAVWKSIFNKSKRSVIEGDLNLLISKCFWFPSILALSCWWL